MKSEWWKNALPHTLSDRHPLRYVRAKVADIVPKLRTRTHGSSASMQVHLYRNRTARTGQGRWWDTSTDEARFWQEEEHIERSHRMEQLEQSLDRLRGSRSGRHSQIRG
jgi:hypothetical protein